MNRKKLNLSPAPVFDALLSGEQLSPVWRNWLGELQLQVRDLQDRLLELEKREKTP